MTLAKCRCMCCEKWEARLPLPIPRESEETARIKEALRVVREALERIKVCNRPAILVRDRGVYQYQSYAAEALARADALLGSEHKGNTNAWSLEKSMIPLIEPKQTQRPEPLEKKRTQDPREPGAGGAGAGGPSPDDAAP